MDVQPTTFYEIMSPRCTALISTRDKNGVPDAAPYSFITPVSANPPMVLISSAPTRRTLANIRETGEFVINMVPESMLDKMMACAKPCPKDKNKIAAVGLTEKKSNQVKAPSIQECVAWIECRLEFEKEAGDHILVVARVLNAACKAEIIKGDQFEPACAKPVMHIRGKRFAVAERVVVSKD